ncbi:MAG: hypothetical protein IJT69_02200 [Clostridia bacterium]|nr:hypothetical protein [Clostridia bacterium]
MTGARHTVLHVVLFIVFLVVAAGLALALAIVFAPVNLSLEEDGYTLSFLFHKESGLYADLEQIDLLDESYTSERIRSYGGISKDFGTYKNEVYGEHFRLTFSENKHNYILLKRTDGSVTVFNQKSYDATAALYDRLAEKLAAIS